MSAPGINEYGRMALEHWQRFRPADFQAMADRESFFRQLGEQAAAQIATLSTQLAGADRPGEGYMAKLSRLQTARFTAREQVIRELLLATPQDEESEQDS